jgi:hypothetical protein
MIRMVSRLLRLFRELVGDPDVRPQYAAFMRLLRALAVGRYDLPP